MGGNHFRSAVSPATTSARSSPVTSSPVRWLSRSTSVIEVSHSSGKGKQLDAVGGRAYGVVIGDLPPAGLVVDRFGRQEHTGWGFPDGQGVGPGGGDQRFAVGEQEVQP